jgi:hypothetical protein
LPRPQPRATAQVDLPLVQELAEPARKAYTATYGEPAPTLTVDARDHLAPPPKGVDDEEGVSW